MFQNWETILIVCKGSVWAGTWIHVNILHETTKERDSQAVQLNLL